MNNVSNYNVFDIKVDENGITNITPRMLNDLATRSLIVMRGANEDLNDYRCGVYYFSSAYKEGNDYFMKLQAGGDFITYITSDLDLPFFAD